MDENSVGGDGMINFALGTTPTILIKLNKVDPSNFVIADLTIKSRKGIVITKNINTATIEGSQISWKLTQKETLGLSTSVPYTVMCNWVTADGTRGITKETSLQILSNHENWELDPYDVEPDTDDDTIIQNDPINLDTYTTPQMYGARADGFTDDTEAIQQAVDSGKSVYLSAGTYVISEPIVIDGKHFWNFHGEDATIRYTGDEYAIRILMAENCRIEIGRIISTNGGGVEFYSDGSDSWNQYVTLSFEAISCQTNCIRSYAENGGWCNENRVFGGRFVSGENGVSISHADGNETDGWKFYNCGIEGVTNGFLFNAGASSQGRISAIAIINPRYAESYSTVLKTVGPVFDCLWVGTCVFKPTEIDCSADTSRFEIVAPIRTIWEGGFMRHRGCIIGGELMAEITSYEEVTQ